MCSIYWLHEINNKQIDNAKDMDVAMPMYNLIEYGDNYAKTSGSIWQYCRDELFTNNFSVINDVLDDPASASFISKQKITVVTLSAQYSSKLLQQLKTASKRTINWNK